MEYNRIEVRNLYRDLLKLTSRSISRKMEREARLAEFRYFFRLHQFEEDIEHIIEVKLVFYTMIDRI